MKGIEGIFLQSGFRNGLEHLLPHHGNVKPVQRNLFVGGEFRDCIDQVVFITNGPLEDPPRSAFEKADSVGEGLASGWGKL